MRSKWTEVVVSAAVLLVAAAPVVSSQVVVSGGEVALKAAAQKNAVNRLIVADSLEIELAQLAVARSQNAAIKEYANLLIKEDSDHLAQLRALAGKPDIGRAADAKDSSAAPLASAVAKIRALPADSTGAAAFDRDFIHAQIDLHTAQIAAFAVVRPAASAEALAKEIAAALPAHQQHLARAQAISNDLDKPAAAKPPTR